MNRNIEAAIKLVKKSKLKMVEVRFFGEDIHYQWQGKRKVQKNVSRLGDILAQVHGIEGYEVNDGSWLPVKKCSIF